MHKYHHENYNQDQERTNGKTTFAFLFGAAVATIVGSYLFFGPNGKRRREAAQSWIDDVEKRILDRLFELKDMTKEKYDLLVDEILDSYDDVKDLTQSQIRRLKARIKSRYLGMRKFVRESAKEARREVDELEANDYSEK